MREERNAIAERDQHLNPCKTKIFPFLFQNRYSIKHRATENRSNDTQNKYRKSKTLNYHTQENSGFNLSSIESPERADQRSKTKSPFARGKHQMSNNQRNSSEQLHNYGVQQSEGYECSLEKYQDLELAVRINEELERRYSEIQKELHDQERKYERICSRYLEFVGSRNDRNNEKVKELLEALEQKQREEKIKDLLAKQYLWMQLEKMKISRRSIETSRRGHQRSWRK